LSIGGPGGRPPRSSPQRTPETLRYGTQALAPPPDRCACVWKLISEPQLSDLVHYLDEVEEVGAVADDRSARRSARASQARRG
jgi:hypothetical protein